METVRIAIPDFGGPALGASPAPDEVFDALGVPVRPLVRGGQSEGRCALVHITVPPLSGPPLHRHAREDEWFYVLDGEITWEVDGERFTGGAGRSVYAPRGTVHTFQNFGPGTAHLIVGVTPAGFERWFEEVSALARRSEVSPEEAERSLAGYGVEVLGPPLG